MADYINVTSLNRLAKQVLAQCDPLNDLIVCGEISGFTRHYKSGHLYFTLKDENASIKTVMFRSQAQLLNLSRRTACWCWSTAVPRSTSGTVRSSCMPII